MPRSHRSWASVCVVGFVALLLLSPAQAHAQADLDLFVVVTPNPAPLSGLVTYTFYFENLGPGLATTPTMQTISPFPAGVSFVAESSPSPGGFCSGTTLWPAWGCSSSPYDLNAGFTAVVTLTVMMPGTPSTVNVDFITASSTFDPNLSNNLAPASVAVGGGVAFSDLVLGVSDSTDPVGPSDEYDYVITGNDLGPTTTSDPRFTMTLPISTTFVSQTGTCDVSAFPSVICDVPSLPVALTIRVKGDSTPGVRFASFGLASASGATVDPVPSNNVAVENTTALTASACGNAIVELGEDCDPPSQCCSASCLFEVVTTPCTDGDFCTNGDACDGSGSCVPGPPNTCDDADSCTVDTCTPVPGSCQNVPVTLTCMSSPTSVFVPAGTNVVVELFDFASMTPGGVRLVFDEVTTGGFLDADLIIDSLTGYQPLFPILNGINQINFRHISDPMHFWILDFAGTFTGNVSLTFQYDQLTLLVLPQRLRVLHYDPGSQMWEPPVPTFDLPNERLTIVVDSLSPFTLGTQDAVPTGRAAMLGTILLMLVAATWTLRRSRKTSR